VGTTKVLPLTVLNQEVPSTGTSPYLNGVSVTSSASSFTVLGPGGEVCTAVQPLAPCTLQIQFAPTEVGDYTAVLTVTPTIGAVSMVTVHGTAAP
jgi:hypothetical protein